VAKQFGLGKGLGALIPETDLEPVRTDAGSPPVEDGVLASGLGAGGEPGAGAAASSASAGEEAAPAQERGLLRLPLGRIEPNPDQPRKTFSPESIAELADSIRRHGLIQPIIVEFVGEGRYRIVAGERRWRAADAAGLREIPVIVRNFSPERRLEIALIENVQREDLNPVEEAEAYKGIMDLTGCTQEEVADKVGKSRPAVANALRLLKLGSAALGALKEGRISPGHARALLSVQDPAARELLLARLMAEELSVRQAEAAAQELNRGRTGRATEPKAPPRREAEIVELEGRLIGAFGTKVEIKGDAHKGSVVIEYYSLEDLERIIDVSIGNR
jgi:ParB family chromosome partitioning protein